MKERLTTLYNKDGTRTVLASILSIIIGMAVGSIIVLIVGFTSSSLSGRSTWEGIRLVLFGILSTGRDAAGNLSFGFNPTSIGNMLFRATPLIMTGLSVAVAYKTGLFNIGAPGQYLMGTMASLMLALGIPTDVVPAGLVWVIAVVAIVFTAIDLKKYAVLSMICYIGMGWCVVLAAKPVLETIPLPALLWLLAGGIAYTVGAVLYGLGKRHRYMHSVFHLFVLAGSILHFVCIFCYII